MTERDRIAGEARRIKREIKQIFTDCAHWNQYVRKADEEPIDPDPDGRLTPMLAGLDAMLKKEATIGTKR